MLFQCSKTCGSGYQFRRLECRIKSNYRNNKHNNGLEPSVQSSICNGLSRPTVSKECAINPCDAKYHWSVGPWTQVIPRLRLKNIWTNRF